VIARLAPDRLGDAGHAIEAGVNGIQVSGVSAPEQLLAIREATTLPPEGRLGLSLSHRAASFGGMSAREYAHSLAAQVIIVQIESSAAIGSLEQLVAIAPRPDVWFLGPMDLSADLGCPGDLDHPSVQTALDRAVRTLTSARAAFGAFATDIADAERWASRGATLAIVGSDMTLLAGATRVMTDRWRSAS
jgi:4-hydroxy-2-oxoheptanedioate aldolase